LIYPYICTSCSFEFEVIKHHKDIDIIEYCPSCGIIGNRTISKHQRIDSTAASDWNKKEYNPAFGKALTPKEARREAKARQWTEVGDEPAHKIQKHFEKQREDRDKKRWDELNLNLGEIK
jgi:predicted  nucleic acid-binding Zn-ribbon protein